MKNKIALVLFVTMCGLVVSFYSMEKKASLENNRIKIIDDINKIIKNDTDKELNNQRKLLIAVLKNDLNAVKKAVKNVTDIDYNYGDDRLYPRKGEGYADYESMTGWIQSGGSILEIAKKYSEPFIVTFLSEEKKNVDNKNMVNEISEIIKKDTDKKLNAQRELLIALIKNDLNKVKNAIKDGADIDYQEKEDNQILIPSKKFKTRFYKKFGYQSCTPLELALVFDDLPIIKYLLENGANPNLIDSYNRNALSEYLNEGGESVEMVNLLLKFKADPNIIDGGGRSALFSSYYRHKPNIMMALIKGGADINLPVHGNTLLCQCVFDNDIKLAETLLKLGADPNIQDDYDATPLIHAVQRNNLSMVNLLLKYNPKINLLDDKGHSALYYAYKLKDSALMETLLKAGADKNVQFKNDKTLLILAVEKDEENIANLLLKYGENTNVLDSDGFSALIYAYISQNIALMEALVKAGADVNVQFVNGYTLLLNALSENNPNIDIVKKLLELGSNPNEIADDGTTPLTLAVLNDLALVNLLLEFGANPNLIDNQGDSVLSIAIDLKSLPMIEALLSGGANPQLLSTEDRKEMRTLLLKSSHEEM